VVLPLVWHQPESGLSTAQQMSREEMLQVLHIQPQSELHHTLGQAGDSPLAVKLLQQVAGKSWKRV
jgi:hypothetical protein